MNTLDALFGGSVRAPSIKIGLAGALAAVALSLSPGCAQMQSIQESIPKPALFSKAGNQDPLVTATSGKVPSERVAAVKKLATFANSERREQIAAELAATLPREPSPPLRAEICATLAQFNSPTADQAVRGALKDSNTEVRVIAAQSLAKHGGRGLADNIRNPAREEATRRALSATLTEEANLDVRLAAVRSLGQFEGDDVKVALGGVLDDSNPAVQRRAMHALAASTGKDFGNDVRAWREFVQGGTPEPRTENVADKVKNFLLTY